MSADSNTRKPSVLGIVLLCAAAFIAIFSTLYFIGGAHAPEANQHGFATTAAQTATVRPFATTQLPPLTAEAHQTAIWESRGVTPTPLATATPTPTPNPTYTQGQVEWLEDFESWWQMAP